MVRVEKFIRGQEGVVQPGAFIGVDAAHASGRFKKGAHAALFHRGERGEVCAQHIIHLCPQLRPLRITISAAMREERGERRRQRINPRRHLQHTAPCEQRIAHIT